MTVLVDACAVIAVLKGEPAADDVSEILRVRPVSIHPLNLAEVIDRMAGMAGADADDVEADVALLGVTTAEPVADHMLDAGRLRAVNYHRSDCPVSLADCVAVIHALRTDHALATSDRHCAAILAGAGGAVIPLPDSSGVRRQL